MFFTHNTQYSLLVLIHVQVQCDLAITRNTCVNVCSLNYLNLFLEYKIGQTCLVFVCFGSMCLTLFLLRDDFESLKCYLDLWLSSMFNCIHIFVFLFFEKLFLSNLNIFLMASRQLSTDKLSIETLQLLFIAFSIALVSQFDPLRNFLSP